MTSIGSRKTANRELSDSFRKRAEVRRRSVRTIGCLALAILLWYGWRLFSAFEGSSGAVGPMPHGHPMHRVVEAAVFLAVAVVPLTIYFITRLLQRRGK
jgi:uncharacterized membrane protein YozB (DUF420 family)